MEFGIYDINVSNPLNFKERLNIYKKVGFSSIGLYIDENYMENDESYEDIITYAKNIGLKINQVHVCYKLSNDICNNSKNYIEYMNKKLEICEKYNIKNMVLHASKGDNPPEINKNQIKMIIKLANNHPSVNLAFENVRNNTNLEKILNSKTKISLSVLIWGTQMLINPLICSINLQIKSLAHIFTATTGPTLMNCFLWVKLITNQSLINLKT